MLAQLDNMDRLLMMTLPVATIAAPVATVSTRPRSRVRRVPIKLRPLVMPVMGWSEVLVLRVLLLHLLFKATAQCAKPVRQVRTPTPVLAPPAPRVVPVLRVATVPTRPRSRVRRAPIKLRPLVTPVTGWSEVRVLRVMLLHLPFKATAQCAKPVRQVRTPTPVLAPPVPLVVPVQRVASVIILPLRVPMAPIKSWPRVMLVMVWSLINAKSVTRVNMQPKATVLPALIVLRYVYPMARVRLVPLRLSVGARP